MSTVLLSRKSRRIWNISDNVSKGKYKNKRGPEQIELVIKWKILVPTHVPNQDQLPSPTCATTSTHAGNCAFAALIKLWVEAEVFLQVVCVLCLVQVPCVYLPVLPFPFPSLGLFLVRFLVPSLPAFLPRLPFFASSSFSTTLSSFSTTPLFSYLIPCVDVRTGQDPRLLIECAHCWALKHFMVTYVTLGFADIAKARLCSEDECWV